MYEKLPDDLISACFDGEATPEERALVEEVLAKSPAARQQWDDYARMSEAIRSFPKHPAPDDLFSAVMHQAERESLLRPLDEGSVSDSPRSSAPVSCAPVGNASDNIDEHTAADSDESPDATHRPAAESAGSGSGTPVAAARVSPAPAESSRREGRRGGWVIATAGLAASVAVVTLLVRILPEQHATGPLPDSIASAPADSDSVGDLAAGDLAAADRQPAEVAEYHADAIPESVDRTPAAGLPEQSPQLMRGSGNASDKFAGRRSGNAAPMAMKQAAPAEERFNATGTAGKAEFRDGLANPTAQGFGSGQAAAGFAMRSSANGLRQGSVVVESLRRQLAVADHGTMLKSLQQSNAVSEPSAVAGDAPDSIPGNARINRRPESTDEAAAGLEAEMAFAAGRPAAVPATEDAAIAVVEVTVQDVPAAIESLQLHLAGSDIPAGVIGAFQNAAPPRPAADARGNRPRGNEPRKNQLNKDDGSRQRTDDGPTLADADAAMAGGRGDAGIPAVYVEAEESMLTAGLDRFLNRSTDVHIAIQPVVRARQLAVLNAESLNFFSTEADLLAKNGADTNGSKNRGTPAGGTAGKPELAKPQAERPVAQNRAEQSDEESRLMSLAEVVQSVRGLLSGDTERADGLAASREFKKRAVEAAGSRPLAAGAAPAPEASPQKPGRRMRNGVAGDPSRATESAASEKSAREATRQRLAGNAERKLYHFQQSGRQNGAPGFQMQVEVAARPYFRAAAAQLEQQIAQSDAAGEAAVPESKQKDDGGAAAPGAPQAALRNKPSPANSGDAATAAQKSSAQKTERRSSTPQRKRSAPPAADRVKKTAQPPAPADADRQADKPAKLLSPDGNKPADADSAVMPAPTQSQAEGSATDQRRAVQPIRVIFLFRQAPQNAAPPE